MNNHQKLSRQINRAARKAGLKSKAAYCPTGDGLSLIKFSVTDHHELARIIQALQFAADDMPKAE